MHIILMYISVRIWITPRYRLHSEQVKQNNLNPHEKFRLIQEPITKPTDNTISSVKRGLVVPRMMRWSQNDSRILKHHHHQRKLPPWGMSPRMELLAKERATCEHRRKSEKIKVFPEQVNRGEKKSHRHPLNVNIGGDVSLRENPRMLMVA